VRNALVSQGVSASRISTMGFGETQPVADNTNEAGKQLNRRVVITIVPQNA
jgi:outer membrane protein OmpA-like peptidoglycan-associated protein